MHEAGVDYLEDDRLGELTPGMRALTVLFVVVGAIDNGGFASLMYNSSGRWIGQALDAARLVGAARHADVFERFVATALGGNAAMGDDERNRRLEAMSDQEEKALEALDESFYALPPVEDLLEAYVNAHPSEFFVD
ncbi:MAG TPA: DUF4375 domain-containing protein [Thermoleophilaceae bacterium]|nr:DUF4375 domain-containing protein [Thermoleophilaceae bacterium]